MTVAAANVEILRRGWNDAVLALAPDVDELPAMLGARLDLAVQRDQLDEQALLDVVNEVAAFAATLLPPAPASNLARRLQRAVYEYLLSLDALTPEETSPPSAAPHAPAAAPGLIGAEEVAALAGRPAEPVLRVVPAPAEPAAQATPEPATAAEPGPTEQSEDEAEEAPPDIDAASNGHTDEPSKRSRFTLFRRGATQFAAEAGLGDTEAEEREDTAAPGAEPDQQMQVQPLVDAIAEISELAEPAEPVAPPAASAAPPHAPP